MDDMGDPSIGGNDPSIGADESAGGETGPSETGSMIGSAAQGASGIAKLSTALIYGQAHLRMQRKQMEIEGALAADRYQNSMKDSLQNEQDAIRNYEMGTSEEEGNLAARGLGQSSIRNNTLSNMAYNQNVRLNAIQRQRALMTHGYEASRQLSDLHWKAMKMQRQEAVVAASIDTVSDLTKVAGGFI